MRSLLLTLAVAAVARAGCSDGGDGGCGPPKDPKFDTWDMASSTYTYCYHDCPIPWFINNTKRLGLNPYAGMVGVDHYYTLQGMPCVNGEPQEWEHQEALSKQWKRLFPGLRFMTYRILSAVPYAMTVENKMRSDPDYFVRWVHQPGSTLPGNGSICYNYLSACFNSPTRINDPSHNCSFPIRAAAYDFKNPLVQDWFFENVIQPAMEYADGVWLDGNGPDNGAYMCSGICCGFGGSNSPHNDAEIDEFCKGEANVTTRAQRWLIDNGGFEVMRCNQYLSSGQLPTSDKSGSQNAALLEHWASVSANHSYNQIVAYGSRTGGHDGYTNETADGAVAAFLLMRGDHWLFSIGGDYFSDDVGRLVTSTYGKALGPMEPVQGQQYVYKREFEGATVQLDCSSFKGTFTEREAAQRADT